MNEPLLKTQTDIAVAPIPWREALPVISTARMTLREVGVSDALSLYAMITPEEVQRFISPPPATLPGFEQFLGWAQGQRANGAYVCFAVVPHGSEGAVGLFQVRQLDPAFRIAEWGFAIGSPYWGTGLFIACARLIVDFVFDTIGAIRLEARAAVQNARGNGALRKLGAVQEGTLRKSFCRDGQRHDQVLWSIIDQDWRQARAAWAPRIH